MSTQISSRRLFLQNLSLTTTGMWLGLHSAANLVAGAQPAPSSRKESRIRLRPDLLDPNSPPGIEIFQLTTEKDVPSSHVYMEAQIFTMDSKRFVLHRSAHGHGSNKDDPKHRYLLCNLEDSCSFYPLTDELGTTGPSISPDGAYFYYFVDRTEVGGGRLSLKRVKLDGTDRQTILVVDTFLKGTKFRPSGIYPLSTISADGKRLAISAFLGDGKTAQAPFGLMVFDVEKATVELIVQGPSWCNMHPQYCRSKEPDARLDILIQENHGNECTPQGEIIRLTGGAGADIHVIRDDGSNFRNLPWGRDGNEICQGHQCWRGRSTWAITGTESRKPAEAQLIEGRASPYAGHVGIKTPGSVRNDLSRTFTNPHFYHFGTDIEGTRLISDGGRWGKDARVYLAELGTPGSAPIAKYYNLLGPKCSCEKDSHIHPFLSPNGAIGFFNSDESGLLQAYMIRGLEALHG